MSRQTFIFLFEPSSVRIEFHITCDDTVTVESLFNPPRDPDAIIVESADQAAREIAARVKAHEEEHRARLSRIRWRGDERPLSYLDINFGVPILPVE